MSDYVDGFGVFLANVKKIPSIRRGEELALGARCRVDPSARKRLVEAYLPLAISRANVWRRRMQIDDLCKARALDVDFEDLVSVAARGLVEAVNHFDPSSCPWVAPYARWWIDKRCRELIARASTQRRNEEPVPTYGDDEDAFSLSLLSDRGAGVEEQAIACLVLGEVRSLDWRTRFVLRRNVEGTTNHDIGSDLGVSEARVRQITRRAAVEARRAA